MQSSITQNHLCMTRRHHPPLWYKRRSKWGKRLKKNEGLRAEPRQSDYNPVSVLLPKSLKFIHPGHVDCICTKKSQFSNPKILKYLILQLCIPLAYSLCTTGTSNQFLLKNLPKLETAMPKFFCIISRTDQYDLNHKWDL